MTVLKPEEDVCQYKPGEKVIVDDEEFRGHECHIANIWTGLDDDMNHVDVYCSKLRIMKHVRGEKVRPVSQDQ